MAKTIVVMEDPEGFVIGCKTETVDPLNGIVTVKKYLAKDPEFLVHRRNFNRIKPSEFVGSLEAAPAPDEVPVEPGMKGQQAFVVLANDIPADPAPVAEIDPMELVEE